MEKCKFCQADLEENSTVCPVCGKDNAEQQPDAVKVTVENAAEEPKEVAPEENVQEQKESAEEKKEAFAGKAAIAVTALIVLIAVLIALVFGGRSKPVSEPEETEAPVVMEETAPPTIPADGNPEDVTCKGSYTAADEEVIAARDVVVAAAGEEKLTLSQLQVYYWMEVRNFLTNYGAYASYFGLDYTQSLDTQVCGIADGNKTWQQFFLDNALNSWVDYVAMATEAKNAGFTLSAEYQQIVDTIESDLEQSAVQNGLENADVLLQKSLGNAVTMADYRYFTELYYNGMNYFNDQMDQIVPTAEELDNYFTTHEGSYGDSGITRDTCTVNVRHILIMPEAADGAEATDADWAAAEKTAQELLKQWEEGEKTEESFAALANEHSTDPGSNTNGGLYTEVQEGQMVAEFNDWCFDTNRQTGDSGIVKTTYGYHIMYFVSSRLVWQDYAASDYLSEKSTELVTETSAKYPVTVDYSAIKLGYVNLGA